MQNQFDNIVSPNGRVWIVPHFDGRYVKRELKPRGEKKEKKPPKPKEPTIIIRDETLKSLKFDSSRIIYARQIIDQFAHETFNQEDAAKALTSIRRQFIDFRKSVSRRMVYMGFSVTVISKAMKFDRKTILGYLRGQS